MSAIINQNLDVTLSSKSQICGMTLVNDITFFYIFWYALDSYFAIFTLLLHFDLITNPLF